MRFKGLDLNLLVMLDALLERQSVTRVAEQLHLSQPAISAGLSRLRDFYSDPLLVLHGKRMVPTPFALQLKPALAVFLKDLDSLVGISPFFDPATSNRKFRISASDFITSVVIADLLPALEQQAPSVELEILPPIEDMLALLDQGELDIILSPAPYLNEDHPSVLLFEERHVVAGWKGNPLMKRPMTMEAFLESGHIAVEVGRLVRSSFAESAMRAKGIQRNIELTVPTFGIVPGLLVHTKRLAVMHERLTEKMASSLPIAYTDLPFELAPMQEMIQFHRTRGEDAGIQWLVTQLLNTVSKRPYIHNKK